jgi:hypothetical protein
MAVRGNNRGRSGRSYGSLEMTGPLFTADAGSTLGVNIRRMLEGVAAEGEDYAKSRINSRKMAPGIVGRVHSMAGAPWWLTAVVSAQYVYPWGSRGGRSFGIQQSGVRRQRGSSKSAPVMHAWALSDAQVLERMGNAQYRGGKQERRTRAFYGATQRMRASRAVLAANLTKGIE